MHGINVYQCQCHHPTHWCPFEFVSGRFNRDTRDAGLADYGLNMRSWGRNLATPNSFPWVGVIQDLKVIWRVVTCWEMRLCSRSRSVEGFHLLYKCIWPRKGEKPRVHPRHARSCSSYPGIAACFLSLCCLPLSWAPTVASKHRPSNSHTTSNWAVHLARSATHMFFGVLCERVPLTFNGLCWKHAKKAWSISNHEHVRVQCASQQLKLRLQGAASLASEHKSI